MTTGLLEKFMQTKVRAGKLGYDLRKTINPDPLHPNDVDQYTLFRRLDGRETHFEDLDKVIAYLKTKGTR